MPLARNDKGFTMIELLIVIAILGILAAIAIPQYSNYRTKSYNSAAISDLRTAATAQDGYFLDALSYATSVISLTGSTYGLSISRNVALNITSGTATGYTMEAYHASGDKTWIMNGPGGSLALK